MKQDGGQKNVKHIFLRQYDLHVFYQKNDISKNLPKFFTH